MCPSSLKFGRRFLKKGLETLLAVTLKVPETRQILKIATTKRSISFYFKRILEIFYPRKEFLSELEVKHKTFSYLAYSMSAFFIYLALSIVFYFKAENPFLGFDNSIKECFLPPAVLWLVNTVAAVCLTDLSQRLL
jgi:hypothetical protein